MILAQNARIFTNSKRARHAKGEVFTSYFRRCEVASERSALCLCVSEASDKLGEKSRKDEPQKKGQKTMNMNVFKRGGRLYIDCQNAGFRVRFSTGLKADEDNLAFVKKHYELFLKDKNLALSKHRAFVDKRFDLKNAPKEPKRAKSAEFDVRNLLHKLLDEKSFLKKGTRKTNEAKAKKLLVYLDNLKICDIRQIKREHCVGYAKFLSECGLKSGTRKNAVIVLRQLLELALNCGLIDKNPYFVPKMRSDDALKISPFSLEEVQTLIKAASGELKSYLIIAFFTGARTGELFGLKWGDIDFEKSEIHIERTKHTDGTLGTPKTQNSKRVIDMLAPVKDELARLKGVKKADEFVFESPRSKITRDFLALCKGLKLAKRRLYDTRHSFASIMLSRGEEPAWVGMKMLGHNNLTMTFKVYVKYMPKSVSTRAAFVAELDLGTKEDEPSLFKELA